MSSEFGPIPGEDYSWYYTKCDGCGKCFYGYEDMNTFVIDDQDYCFDCAIKKELAHKNKNGRTYVNGNIYRIAHTFSSLYDGPGCYFTSLDWLIKSHEIVCTKHYEADPMLFNWGYGLTGHIDQDHWRVFTKEDYGSKCEYAFIYEPSEVELSKLKKYEVRG